jgi:hypothetical protein
MYNAPLQNEIPIFRYFLHQPSTFTKFPTAKDKKQGAKGKEPGAKRTAPDNPKYLTFHPLHSALRPS